MDHSEAVYWQGNQITCHGNLLIVDQINTCPVSFHLLQLPHIARGVGTLWFIFLIRCSRYIYKHINIKLKLEDRNLRECWYTDVNELSKHDHTVGCFIKRWRKLFSKIYFRIELILIIFKTLHFTSVITHQNRLWQANAAWHSSQSVGVYISKTLLQCNNRSQWIPYWSRCMKTNWKHLFTILLDHHGVVSGSPKLKKKKFQGMALNRGNYWFACFPSIYQYMFVFTNQGPSNKL